MARRCAKYGRRWSRARIHAVRERKFVISVLINNVISQNTFHESKYEKKEMKEGKIWRARNKEATKQQGKTGSRARNNEDTKETQAREPAGQQEKL